MVKKNRLVVIWNNRASIYFRKAYEYIKEESYTNAEKVKEGITKMVDSCPIILRNTHLTSSRKTIRAITERLKNIPTVLLTNTLSKR